MTVERAPAGGRHRGEHRDPVGTALAGFWALGHVVTVFLLGTAAVHQLDDDHLSSVRTAHSVPDREPPACARAHLTLHPSLTKRVGWTLAPAAVPPLGWLAPPKSSRRNPGGSSPSEGKKHMVQDTPAAPAADGGLLVAARKINAARTRAEQPSDNTGGRSDQNDT